MDTTLLIGNQDMPGLVTTDECAVVRRFYPIRGVGPWFRAASPFRCASVPATPQTRMA